jgi:hypothetical protein
VVFGAVLKLKAGIAGVPGGTRTHDPLLRRQLLYPAELQGQADIPKNVARIKPKVNISIWIE